VRVPEVIQQKGGGVRVPEVIQQKRGGEGSRGHLAAGNLPEANWPASKVLEEVMRTLSAELRRSLNHPHMVHENQRSLDLYTLSRFSFAGIMF
jgi:hypothetical protein